MPNHDGTGPAKECCKGEEQKQKGCGCGNKQHNHGEGGGCCQSGEQHRHHGEHAQHEGCCKKNGEKQ